MKCKLIICNNIAFETELKEKEEYNANLQKGKDVKLIDKYLQLYTREGKLISDKRNYVLLDGVFVDKNGNSAIVPRIKYVFKH